MMGSLASTFSGRLHAPEERPGRRAAGERFPAPTKVFSCAASGESLGGEAVTCCG
jgi:hypothetical protein